MAPVGNTELKLMPLSQMTKWHINLLTHLYNSFNNKTENI